MIALYNLGAELEFVKRLGDASDHYKSARAIASRVNDQALLSKIEKALKQIEA